MKPKITKDEFSKYLSHELLRFCGPIFVAPALNSYPGTMIGNGTYALIDTGEKRLLITCSHVWDEYGAKHDQNSETVLALSLGEGDSNIAFKDPKSHRIAIDRDLDLVVLEFEPDQIHVPHRKSWFKISDWPIQQAEKGDCIITLGFPGAWRKTAGLECKFECVVIPVIVTDTNDRTIAAFSDNKNKQVLNDMKDSMGGFSGSPAYRLNTNGEMSLVGFTKIGPEPGNAPERKYLTSPDSDLLLVQFTHACFLRPNGMLSRQ
jgi:hypothetical protein